VSGLAGAAGPTERGSRPAPLGAAQDSAAGPGGAGVPPLPGVPHLQQALRVSQAPGRYTLQDRAQQRPAAEQCKSFLKGHGYEPVFPMFLHKPVRHGSLTLIGEPFLFWLRILGDIRNRKTTPRIGESGSRQLTWVT
jgi:hypothetical protein